MKPKLFALVLCCILICTAKAQYVNIPDSNFRSFLIAKYPTCFNSSMQMDTTCYAIVNEDSLNQYLGTNILSIEGVQYFDNLKYLDIGGTSILSIHKYPPNLIGLDFSNSAIDSIKMLPNTLKYLSSGFSSFISPCSLVYIDKFPENLEELAINGCPIKKLPHFPTTIKFLWLNSIQIDSFPTLPDSLISFVMISDSVTKKLPTLPNKLRFLLLDGNSIETFTNLPASLKILECFSNSILQLPSLPSGLLHLNCYNNQLTSLPTLPSGLLELYCGNNFLSSLPNLPNGLQLLDCAGNNLFCLPPLPKTIAINFDTSKIKCLPNPIVGFNYPVCNATNNINSCQNFGFANVAGKVFYDANSNGVKDSVEVYSNNTMVNFAGISAVITNNNGDYNFGTDSLATYIVIPTTPIANTVFNPQMASITINKIDTVVTQNFAIQPTAIKDSIEVALTVSKRTRAGGVVWFQVDIKNAGTTNLTNVSSVLNFDAAKLIFDTCKPLAFVNTGNSVTVNLPTIPFGGHYTYYGWFSTKTTAAIGDTIKLNATVTNGIVLANTPANTIVSASYDPNDKTATPELSTQQVADGKRIDYTIRFQNTGNDTAIHIVIADTLSSKLQANSLQIIANSHDCKISIKDGIVFFEMRNIMLPDSNIDNTNSNGFIRFSMLAKTNVIAGDNISNSAAIYFDYNKPIITNSAITQIKNNVLPVSIINYELRMTNEGSVPSLLERVGVRSSWTTSNEINTNYFVVQRSTNGKVFNSIGSVAAKGFTGNYSFIDELKTIDQLPNILYYRLQSVDKNGKYSFSEVRQIAINAKQKTRNLSIYPNPAQQFINIKFNKLIGTAIVVIVDVYGKQVLKQNINNQSTKINIQQLAKGTYLVKITTMDNETKTEKLILE